jgi:hypothetical protein
VFVALADNRNQGIVPVPAKLGNGADPERNLYWGAAGGVKTFFARSREWHLVFDQQRPKPGVLERCVFQHRDAKVYLIADAYQGDHIKQALADFLGAAAGAGPEQVTVKLEATATNQLDETRGDYPGLCEQVLLCRTSARHRRLSVAVDYRIDGRGSLYLERRT